MTFADLNRQSVLDAIDEFEEIGRVAFLERYGFAPARSYLLVHNGRTYDSKAIVGSAHGYATGVAWRAGDFSGGDATVGRVLRGLGFTVQSVTSPDWDWQEVVLACDLVEANGWQELRVSDTQVQELSALLRRLPIHPFEQRPDNFRSPGSVSRKTTDLATAHPDYTGKRTRGGKTDRLVLDQFRLDRSRMKEVAAALRAAADSEDLDDVVGTRVEDPTDAEAEEGGLLLRLHQRRERSPKLRAKKIEEAIRRGEGLRCRICDFDYGAAYGSHGEGYIESHHIVPLHVTGSRTVRLADLILICSNCHRMIHRRTPWKTPDELRTILLDQRGWKMEQKSL